LPLITIKYKNGDEEKTITGKQERPDAIKELQRMLEDISKMEGYISLEPKEEEVVEEETEEEEKDDSLIENEFIVKFNKGTFISKWIKGYKEYKLSVKRPLTDDRLTWLLQYNKATMDPQEFLAKLQADSALESVEVNKKMESR